MFTRSPLLLLCALLCTLSLSNCSYPTSTQAGQSKGVKVSVARKAKKSIPRGSGGLLSRTPLGSRASAKSLLVRTTAYSDKENEKGAYKNQTCIGTVLRYGKVFRSAAADWSRYPLGTQFRIKGQPHIYVVEDYGSALVGTETIDIYKPTLSSMRAWGVRNVEIEIVEWGCYDKSLGILSKRTKYPHCRAMYNNIKKKHRA